jgi:HD-GYP domain-containing protein (c-di-GMP phosphodiesterase class II)/ABC-type amino acid transport substrate-binding protein
MNKSPGKLRTSIQLTVVLVFVLATTLTAALAIGLQYYFGHSLAKQSATRLYGATSANITSELINRSNTNRTTIELLAENPLLANPADYRQRLQIFTQVLENNPLFYGLYLGHADGSFFELVNLDSNEIARRALRALPGDRWLLISVDDTESGRTRQFRYMDANLKVRLVHDEPTDFDPTRRPWYIDAMASTTLASSEPYLFAQLGVPGTTISKRVSGTDTVVAADMTLSSISGFLAAQDPASSSDIYLYNGDGDVIASSLEQSDRVAELPFPHFELTANEQELVDSLPVLKISNEEDWAPFDYAQSGIPRGYSVDVMQMIAKMTGIRIEFVNGYSWQELVGQFQKGDIDVLTSLILTSQNQGLGLPGRSYASLPYALVTQDGQPDLSKMQQMKGKRLAIPSGWSVIPIVQARFPDIEIVEASSTLHALRMVNQGIVDAALDSDVILRYIADHYFLENLQFHSDISFGAGDVPDTLHLLVAGDRPQLRALLDRAIDAIGPEQQQFLRDYWLDSTVDHPAPTSRSVPSRAMITTAVDSRLHNTLVETQYKGETYLLFSAVATKMQSTPLYVGILAPQATVMGPMLDKVKLSIGLTALLLLALAPLSWLFSRPIVQPVRQLALENDKIRRRSYDDVQRVNSRIKELDELSESMVNMANSIQAHELAQRNLMDSFIKLIAQAIDDKSAYTGGHCERVPELALMLAHHASDSKDPAFREFQLHSDDEWREYRIAAWLHDCGKITTPEHIVDKGSKLEAIYNRLHEVRMRFEVLWRDAEIDCLQQLARHPEQELQLQNALLGRQQQLIADFEFVAACNVGGEFMDDSDRERLLQIARQTWQRHFSDRIGLSPVEELRSTPELPLPTTEPLLSDRADHVIRRPEGWGYPTDLGINMDIPDHLYNQGEIYNLSISRGTLTSEDRFKINEHMISTIKMLESLPFPDELKNVPRYASTHHETMKGSGYPRRLSGDELSIPERILAVADIFEALTASDRPYKKAKTISVAIDILHNMVLDNHVDRDCFELFVREGVYLEYARQYLKPEQIDDVDVGKYLSLAP